MSNEDVQDGDIRHQGERLARLETTVDFLAARLNTTVQEWRDIIEKHASEEKKNREAINEGLHSITKQLQDLISQNTRWKGAVGGATLVLSTLGAIVWYLGAQLGFSILSLFQHTGK